MAMTPIPALDRTSATFKTDVDTFFGTRLPAFASEANALQADVDAKQSTASTAATTATSEASTATAKATEASNSAADALASQSAAATSASNAATSAAAAEAAKNATTTGTKADLGLGNVDNTSDANKPISTATKAALDQLAYGRNKIINGAFKVNQRGYVSGASTTAGQYTIDRWKVTGTAGITYITTSNKTTITIPTGQTLQQVIEGLNIQSGNYVLSWDGTANGSIDGGAYGSSGSVTAYIAGGVDTVIEFSPGTLSNVQLEAGSVVTPFENLAYGIEITLCQRYYEFGEWEKRTYSQYGTSDRVRFFTTKRAAPTMIISNATGDSTGTGSISADIPTVSGFRAGADWTSVAAWRTVYFTWVANAEL